MTTSTGILDTDTVATDEGGDDKKIAERNSALTTMIVCIASGITIICCGLWVGVWCRTKKLGRSIMGNVDDDENNLANIQNVPVNNNSNPMENKVHFPRAVMMNLRSVSSGTSGEHDGAIGNHNLETNKDEIIGEQRVNAHGVGGTNGVYVSKSKSRNSLYGESVHQTDDCIVVELQPTLPVDGDLRFDNGQKTTISQYDTSNWEDWHADQVCKYVEYLLIENNYNQKDIDELMNQVLLKMKITGKVLKTLKENDALMKQFQNKIENHSFGIWIVIANALEQL